MQARAHVNLYNSKGVNVTFDILRVCIPRSLSLTHSRSVYLFMYLSVFSSFLFVWRLIVEVIREGGGGGFNSRSNNNLP